MTSPSQVPKEIVSICERCSEGLSGIVEIRDRVELVRGELPKLQKNGRLFAGILSEMLDGSNYPDLRLATMFDNELLLYRDPGRKFSLRAFLWEPGGYTPVHDHGSWGVIGPVGGELEVINYRREDDGSERERTRLVERERFTIRSGETAYTLPFNDGIHAVGNPTDETILSLSLYGSPTDDPPPRGYILGFDIEKGRAYHIFSPHTKKKLLAVRALSGLDPALGDKALKKIGGPPAEIIERSEKRRL